MMEIVLDGGSLTRPQVVAVARKQASVTLGDSARELMLTSREVVEDVIQGDRIVYGITTGFGALATTHIGRGEVDELQHRLVRSHAAAVGEPLDAPIVRAMLVLRARTLAQGHSGVRPVVVEQLLNLQQLPRWFAEVFPSSQILAAGIVAFLAPLVVIPALALRLALVARARREQRGLAKTHAA